jgi:hypothetical protein
MLLKTLRTSEGCIAVDFSIEQLELPMQKILASEDIDPEHCLQLSSLSCHN